MAFIPVPNVAKVSVEQELDGEPVVNTLYFYNANGWGMPGLTNLALDIGTWWASGLAPQLSTAIALEQVVATDLSAQISSQYTYEPENRPNGLVVSDSIPNNAALCVSLRSPFRGRSARGRNYVGGIPEIHTTRSRVRPETIQGIIDAYEQLLTVGPQNSSTWVVVSTRSNKQPRAEGVFLPVQSVVVVDDVLDSQKRRLPGRGA